MTTPYLTLQQTSSTDAASGLRLGGDWTLAHYSQLEPQVLALRERVKSKDPGLKFNSILNVNKRRQHA